MKISKKFKYKLQEGRVCFEEFTFYETCAVRNAKNFNELSEIISNKIFEIEYNKEKIDFQQIIDFNFKYFIINIVRQNIELSKEEQDQQNSFVDFVLNNNVLITAGDLMNIPTKTLELILLKKGKPNGD